MDFRDHSFFKLLDARRAEAMARSITVVGLERGEVLFKEGTPSDSMFLVLSGSIAFTKQDPSGKLVTLARVQADDYFGEFGALDGEPRSATATADIDCSLARIPRAQIVEIFQSPGDTSLRLVNHIIRKIRESNSRYVTEMLRNERMSTVGGMANKIIHDFKNPFAVIRMAVGMLELGNEHDVSAQQWTRMISDQIDRIVVMADDILQFSKGQTTLVRDEFDVADMLARFETLYSQYLKEQRVELVVQGISKRMNGDEGKLLRVLQNLVNNAAESFVKKPARIVVSAKDLGSDVQIAVQDNGPGLPEAIRAKAFEMFSSVGKSTGTGLGMAISKSIVMAHGGKISYETKTDEGTTFFMILPVSGMSDETVAAEM